MCAEQGEASLARSRISILREREGRLFPEHVDSLRDIHEELPKSFHRLTLLLSMRDRGFVRVQKLSGLLLCDGLLSDIDAPARCFGA